MEPEGSLLCSQELATGLYPESDASDPQLPAISLRPLSNIILPSASRSSKQSVPFRYLDEN
jgi:hypothetical protein